MPASFGYKRGKGVAAKMAATRKGFLMAEITDSVTELAHKAFLAGVGAVAYGAEKTGEFVDTLVKKGELTVEQGKELNTELTQKAKETVDGAQETVLKARLAAMTAEERAAFVARAEKLTSDLNAADAEKAAAAEAEPVEADEVEEAEE